MNEALETYDVQKPYRKTSKVFVCYGKHVLTCWSQIAGILGAKKTSDLIPLCHPLALTKVDVSCKLSAENEGHRVLIECEAR